jgi:hypothetical protein
MPISSSFPSFEFRKVYYLPPSTSLLEPSTHQFCDFRFGWQKNSEERTLTIRNVLLEKPGAIVKTKEYKKNTKIEIDLNKASLHARILPALIVPRHNLYELWHNDFPTDLDNVKKVMKDALENRKEEEKPSPLRGEGKGGGERRCEMPFLPLTLTLSPKGRGRITLDNAERRCTHG